MNALLSLLEGVGGKLVVTAVVGLLAVVATCVIFWSTISGWWKTEPPTTNLGSALARTKSAAAKNPPSGDSPKQGARPSPRRADDDEDTPQHETAAAGPRQGKGEPMHFYHIEPFAVPSTLRVHVPSSFSETDAKATALRLSTNLVAEADRFTVWFLEDDTFLTTWTGSAALEADAKKRALWKIDTSRDDNGAFRVDAVQNLLSPLDKPRS